MKQSTVKLIAKIFAIFVIIATIATMVMPYALF
jgi:hypothetical protein